LGGKNNSNTGLIESLIEGREICHYTHKERAMKKLYTISALIIASFAVISSASAAPWTAAVNADIASGNYAGINQVVAGDPAAAGAIGAYLLQQAQADAGSNPGKSVKLLGAATPLGGQISPTDAPGAVGNIEALVALANTPGFQQSNPKGTAKIFADALNLLALPNLGNQNPHLQGIVLAEAEDFLKNNPDADDTLKDEVSLAMGFDLNGVNPDLDTIRLHQHGPDIDGTPSPE
jgi:hypothetical protein